MAKRVSREIHVYTEDDLLKLCNDKIKGLYSDLKSALQLRHNYLIGYGIALFNTY